MYKQFFSEMIGTFIMVFIGCYAIKTGQSSLIISLSFGSAVFLVILCSRRFSGAHINPAVSIAFTISGDLEKKLLPIYLFAQIIGATIAAVLVGPYGATNFSVAIINGVLIEIFITFILMYSIYLIVSKTDRDEIVALVVGGVVAILAFLFGKYTGASMNPARTFGPNLISYSIGPIPVYLISTIIGASIAAFLHNKINVLK